MKKKIAGIDYSLTSPAICVYKDENGGHFDFDRCMLHYLSNNERQQQLAARCGVDNLKAEPYPEWKTEEERHEKLATWAYNIVQGCEEVFLEGYAFATSAQAGVRSIAENTGLLKHKMWKNKITFKTYPPTVIKKFATGKGNANKEVMYEAFVDELLTPTDLKERLTPKATKVKNPISDIVDAYFIAKCGVEGVL
jgi:Holliday junction resolvasome RuvABC endonuclease subunit